MATLPLPPVRPPARPPAPVSTFFYSVRLGFQNDTAAAEAGLVEGEGGGTNPENPSPESLGHTLSWLRRAVELDPSSYDAWHAWALMNYQITKVKNGMGVLARYRLRYIYFRLLCNAM